MNRRTAVATMFTGALLAFPASGLAVGTHVATANVVTAIERQDKLIVHNAGFKTLENLSSIQTDAEARAAIPKLQSLAKVMNRAGRVVSRASATTGQRTGQIDWVKGIKDEAKAVDRLAVGYRDVVNGEITAGKAAVVKADKLARKAIKLGNKGERLLGLPT